MLITEEKIKLTQYSHGSGCGCKIAPAVLSTILQSNEAPDGFDKLLVGNHSRDDAAVYDLGNGEALISTTDFFMPVVDDPFDFGRIAAANAISDIYAMGGKPLLAVAILGFPVEKISPAVAQQIVAGGRAMCKEAGIPLAGGHSIDSHEPIFGLAVNGTVPVKNLKRNNTAREGDLLFLTKPLGIGIINTALKRGVAKQQDADECIRWMCTLNTVGNALGLLDGVHALTDVTGFGLMGHLIEMAEGSGLSAEVYFEKLPLIKNITHYLDQFIYPDMTMKNYSAYREKTNELNARQLFITCDPQTSGGLLVAIDPKDENTYKSTAKQFLIEPSFIGRMIARSDKIVFVK